MTLALLVSLLAFQEPTDDRLKELIANLQSEDIETREKATLDLVALGVGALPKLEKAQAGAVGEVRARLGTAIEKLRIQVHLIKLAPPAKLVSVSVKDRPLEEVLRDLSTQSGLRCECDPAVARVTVTVEARDEPLLKVLDQACRTRADVTFEIAKGKIRFIPGEHPDVPTAYTGAYRARLKRVTEQVLYFRFDAQPDQPYLSATGTGSSPVEDFTIRPASQVPMKTWMMSSLSGLTVRLDDVQVRMDKGDEIGSIWLVKSVKASTLGTLQIRVRFLFAVDSKPAELSLVEKGRKLAVGDYACNFRGPRFFVHRDEAKPNILRPQLGELMDLNSFVVTDADGKKFTLISKGKRADFPYEPMYEFLSEAEWKGLAVKLEYKIFTLAEREVEFELKDVKLRD